MLGELEFQFSHQVAVAQRDQLRHRLREHLIARGRDLDAPLVVVLVGSTGVGKSTIINSLVGPVTTTSAQRPTTLTPVLVHHPDDELWLAGNRILEGFEKIRIENEDETPAPRNPNQPLMKVKVSDKLPSGIVLVDTLDTDSYREENRHITAHLAEVGDLWIFVTTAQRYAQPQGLALLRQAVKRQAAVGIVLNRVGRGGLIDSKQGLSEKLVEVGLPETPIFTILESELEQGSIPESDLEPLRKWLEAIASDALLRSALARQTFFGSLEEALGLSFQVVDAFEAETDESVQIQNRLDEFAAEQKERCRDQWYQTKIFSGDPINRFAQYSWQIIEENLAENAWVRRRLRWQKSLLAANPAPKAAKSVIEAALEFAFNGLESRLHEALSLCATELQIAQFADSQGESTAAENLPDAETQRRDSKTGIYQQWWEQFSTELEQTKPQSRRDWDARVAQTIFQALLIRCFHPWETASQEFLLHYFTASDMAELVGKLREIMGETLDARVDAAVAAVARNLPDTSENPERAKAIRKFITELQEQWFS